MSEEKHGPDISALRNPGVDYERSDASVRGVVWFLFVLTIAGVVISLVLAGLYKFFAGPEVSLLVHQPSRGVYGASVQPPEPRLQPDPVMEMNELAAIQEQRLHGYGWVDQKSGVAHIPIERAMELLAQRGLPQRPPQPATQFRENINYGAAAAGGVVTPAAQAQKQKK